MPKFFPKMGIMKISASFPPWDGRPWLLARLKDECPVNLDVD